MECIEQGRGSRATAFRTLARGDCARQLLELVYPRHFHGGGRLCVEFDERIAV